MSVNKGLQSFNDGSPNRQPVRRTSPRADSRPFSGGHAWGRGWCWSVPLQNRGNRFSFHSSNCLPKSSSNSASCMIRSVLQPAICNARVVRRPRSSSQGLCFSGEIAQKRGWHGGCDDWSHSYENHPIIPYSQLAPCNHGPCLPLPEFL